MIELKILKVECHDMVFKNTRIFKVAMGSAKGGHDLNFLAFYILHEIGSSVVIATRLAGFSESETSWHAKKKCVSNKRFGVDLLQFLAKSLDADNFTDETGGFGVPLTGHPDGIGDRIVAGGGVPAHIEFFPAIGGDVFACEFFDSISSDP